MSDIFVVGDVHGNYPKLISALGCWRVCYHLYRGP